MAVPEVFQMDKRKGVGAILVASSCMGLSGLLNRGATRVDFFGSELIGGESIGAFMTVGRMVAGFLFFVALLLITRKTALFRATRLSPSIVLGGLSVGVSFAFYLVASLLTTLANAVFLIYTGPLFCAILARVFRRELISRFQGVCLGLVLVGMLLTSGIVTIDAEGVRMGQLFASTSAAYPQQGLGDAFGLLSGVFYGLSLFFNGYRKDCDTTVRGVWNFLFATIGAGAVAACMCGVWPVGEVSAQPVNVLFMVLLWVICGPLGMGMLLVAGRNLPAVEYSTIAYWECVVSIIASVVVFQEPLAVGTIMGGVLIITGGALPAVQTLRSPGTARTPRRSRRPR